MMIDSRLQQLLIVFQKLHPQLDLQIEELELLIIRSKSMRKKSGEVYNFKWEELDPIRVKHQQTPSKNCVKRSKTLTPEDRSSFFLMDRGNDDESLQFVSICWASKVTGI